MPPPKLEFPGFEKSGGENASHMDLGGGASIYIYIYVQTFPENRATRSLMLQRGGVLYVRLWQRRRASLGLGFRA